ncbi:hypothetical protein [Streptomyces sp. XC 2026]|uniref:hypothetical protein n=1 Tax=Streptomyces sp. XC 2026 TaxID=2782004 RepID=UPI0019087A7A|nr:hypothetical protein [Streptomyces sp. XC 2026]QQN77405.1 hypothetical protein IPZ77_08040 [Streptomyces sp. XC 2026]
MDVLWWIVLLVIAGVALVAALVDGVARLGTHGSGRARRRRPWGGGGHQDDGNDRGDGPAGRG